MYAVTIKFLIDAGHDIIVVAQMGLAQASVEEILRVAQAENRILGMKNK